LGHRGAEKIPAAPRSKTVLMTAAAFNAFGRHPTIDFDLTYL
jgi:hypothetical protein